MNIQSAVQEATTNIINALQEHRIPRPTSSDWINVRADDLSLIMEALAVSWPPKETIDGLTAKVQYLLDTYVSLEDEGEEGHFIFPDGDSWIVRNETKKKKCLWRAVIRAVDSYWAVQNSETGDDWPDYRCCISKREAHIVADFANWLEARYNKELDRE